MASDPRRRHVGAGRARRAHAASRLAAAVLVALGVALAASPADAAGEPWRRTSWGQGGGPVTAIAVDPASGEVAFGDERGASRVRGSEPPRRVVRAPGVTDLAFARGGVLWIATLDGLWRHAPDAPSARASVPAPGEAARRIRRLAVAGGTIAVASDAGAFASSDGRRWVRLRAGASSGPASHVALGCTQRGGCEVWWVVGRAVWRGLLEEGAPDLVAARQEIIAGAPNGIAPIDVLPPGGGASAVVAYPRAVALGNPVSAREGRPRDARDALDGIDRIDRIDWTVWRPVLPPGAVARRIVRAAGALWLATDRGLLWARDPRLGWERAASPAGWRPTFAAAADTTRLFSATADGLLVRDRVVRAPAAGDLPAVVAEPPPTDPVGSEPSPTERGAPPPRSAPAVGRVHAMALAHLGLDPERQRALRTRAARRSWWPELDLSVGYGGDRSERHDFDQAFVSGETRHLFDRDRDRGDDWGAELSLRWDLAAAAFDPEVIDLAREERAWISLRDDVLDEINLLYFERQRVLLDLRAQPDPATADAARLRLRAGELAAGLDSWTGGGFSRALAHPDRNQE